VPAAGAQATLERDLAELRGMGVALDVLFNANCYGELAMSRALEAEVNSVLDRLDEVAGGADAVTTTSPAVAHMVKRRRPNLEVRASVNMRIGSAQGMGYLSDLFDGFYVRRDHNRDLAHLRDLKEWADANGKRLYLLANSGCLRDCSGQTFHDNMVAHETAVAAADNIEGFMPYTCWKNLANRSAWPLVLQATWIRPEDLHHYEGLFGMVKLATRLHARPDMVIRAYAERRHDGNLLDLMEPGFSSAFAPFLVDNRRFPEDWFDRTSHCGGRCHRCSYCREVLERVLVNAEEMVPGT
jgi:collagenase-like PrtC family protease